MNEPTVSTLARFDPLAATIAKYETENTNLDFDLHDKQGIADAKSYISMLRKTKGAIAEAHKEVKAEALAFGRLVDARKNEYTGRVDKMINRWAVPIKEIEQAEYRRMAEQAEALRLEKEAKEAERLAELEAREAAIAAKEQAAKEEEDRETRERAARIAEENAKIAAENEKLRLAQAKLEEEKRALEAKQLAEEDAHRREMEAREAERQRIFEEQEAEQAEKARLADIEAKRVANVKHRAKIEQDAFAALYTVISDAITSQKDVAARKVLDAIRDGNIPHVTIVY